MTDEHEFVPDCDCHECAKKKRDMAIWMLAEWCVAVSENGAGWDDWYALYARAAKERTAALEDVERWKKAAESNIEENVGLRLAEEGAKEAFAHVVQQKRDFEAECKRLRGLLDGAHDTIRRQAVTPNAK